MPMSLDGSSLTIEKLVAIARDYEKVELAPEALERIKVCRAMLEEKLANKEIMYGTNTGIGEFSETMLNDEQVKEFQKYLIYNHAAGIGEPAPIEYVRAALAGRPWEEPVAKVIVNPPWLPKPSGYSHGIEARGRLLFVAGQTAQDADGRIAPVGDLVGQFRQALDNPPPVLRCANAGPEHIARMTWFITDKRAYLAALAEIGQIWREKMGRHYPAMAVVEVKALIEDAALIEIETTAVVPR